MPGHSNRVLSENDSRAIHRQCGDATESAVGQCKGNTMRIARFIDPASGTPRPGIVVDGMILEASGNLFEPGSLRPGKTVGPVGSVWLAPPVVPGKVVCVGLNYAAHAAEHDFGRGVGDEPVIFLKAPSAVIGPDAPIMLAFPEHRTDLEAELAVVIGSRARNVPESAVADVVFGYTVANDICDRVIQEKDGQWMRAKSYDTYCPLGPWIETDFDPSNAPVRSRLNGEPRQDSSTSAMVFGVPYLVSFISRVMTLEPGDVILTGTPEGIGAMHPGDVVEVEVGGIGVLRNPVTATT
jgi:2-keto-4-pentenoate hydratase/2-oxohepta-3-ene-1,7-dioic acid hydratase in catechol pathway